MGKYINLKKCYLIAEIGVNHNGNMSLAKEMINAAIASGADAVKFQTFKAETLVTKGTPKVRYQEATTIPDETHYQMIEKLELKEEQHILLKDYCDENSIDFISTPYDPASVDFLESLGVQQYKIASADLVDLELLKRVATTKKPVLLSVGMARLGEIEDALQVFSDYERGNLLLLHCVSNYPCSDESLNLRVMKTLETAFNYPIGYSDHSVGSQASILSLALGAKVIEKHFTLDKTLPGPDQKSSSTPDEFKKLSKAVRRAELMLGSGIKSCQPEEMQMSLVSRKSITLARDMNAGDVITHHDLIMMRPGTGLPAKVLQDVIGLKLRKGLSKDSLVRWTDLESI
jgi:N,N'-diacetyllegionaminate synthase